MKKTLFLLVCLLFTLGIQAQNSVFGTWKTIDDETGKAKSIVEVFEKDGKAYAKVQKVIFSDNGTDPVCTHCPGDRKDQKVVGMQIIDGLKKDGDEWSGSKILDPNNGKLYNCKMWLEDDSTLKVRGYVAFLYRTQTWYRVE